MKKFFGKNREASLAKATLLEQYLQFTASPTRNRIQRTHDYDLIRALDMFAGLTFYKPHILAIGTKTVYIRSKRNNAFRIGDFIIYLVRKRIGRRWITEFYLENITDIKEGSTGYDHPHVSRHKQPDDFDHKVGTLCIQNGHHSVYQSIREARIPDAVQTLISILHTVQYGTYIPLNRWPLVRGL